MGGDAESSRSIRVADRAHLDILECRAAGGVEKNGRYHQHSDASANTGVPAEPNPGAVKRGIVDHCGAAERSCAGNTEVAFGIVSRADIAFESVNPESPLDIEAGVQAAADRRIAEVPSRRDAVGRRRCGPNTGR